METDRSVAIAMSSDPNLLLPGETPRLFDEWQKYPKFYSFVRHEIDHRKQKGQFILTGSSTPKDEADIASGAGRISRVRMRPMSWQELGWSDGSVPLEDVLLGKKIVGKISTTPIQEIIERVAIGGWPGNIGLPRKTALRNNRDYIDLIAETKISEVSESYRDPVRVRRMIESYARNIATSAKLSTLIADTAKDTGDASFTRATADTYLRELQRLMIVEDLECFKVHIRSAAKLRTTPKRHFADPSLAVAALTLSPDLLVKDLNYFGFLFESAVIHNLRVYADALGATVYYYLDTDGDEVDAIIELPNGKFAAFEVKLGQGAEEEAVASLLRFREKLSDNKQNDLVSLNIVIGSGVSYTRDDGINIIPIGTLGVKSL
jgi:predicted AAA+ superfamily ATPase